jgi:hypothetical protein
MHTRSRLLTNLSLLFAIGAAITPAQAADASSLKPGKYEGLMLAVDPAGNLSGYYRESQGEGVSKTCTFFLKGKVADNHAELSTWSDQVYPGVLKADGADVNLQIEKGRDFPGCGLVLMPEIAQGIKFDKTLDAKWSDLEIVASNRAYLYSAPAEDKKLKSYLIKGDVVGALSTNGDWVQVEFPREGKKSVSGWINVNDVKALQPPK